MQNKRGKLISHVALCEIFLLVLSIFAFGSIIGEASLVSAQSTTLTAGGGNWADRFGGWVGKTFGAGEAGAGDIGAENLDKAKPVDGGPFEILGKIWEGEVLGGTETLGGIPAHLISGAAWAIVAGGITYMIASAVGASDEQAKAAAYAVAIGTGIARFGFLQASATVAGEEAFLGTFFEYFGFTQSGALLWGVGISVVIFILLYKEESKKTIQFQCNPWEAPLGGSDCEKCNDNSLKPCSEYRCRSLGQACDLVNKGTEEEKCIWVSRDDVTSPTITPWNEALSDGHKYTRHEARPPSLGTKIIRADNVDGCIKPFTPLEFGVETNEPAQCKIDSVSTNTFDEMTFFFGGSNFYRQDHTERMRLPSPNALAEAAGNGSFVLGADGRYNFYVRCRDANGNENVDEFVFTFCVDPSPDTTPPVIEDTSIISGSPVSFGSEEVELSVFINEPAECKWSIQDKSYDDMENVMECSEKVYQQNAQQLYPCTTTLTGIKDREENKFFFRCKDQPSKPDNERNVNAQSHEFVLLGSQELNIISVSPTNETITGSTEVVAVDLEIETSNGAEEGDSICYFSPTGEEGSFISMFETNSFEHKQTLTLTSGDYEYHFRCIDLGGNSDTSMTGFSVFIDTDAPLITRVYKELDALKIITSEDAECAYSLNNCNFVFDEGIKMIYSDPDVKNNHFAKWESNLIYYIKCRDDFGNQPSPNQCSLIAGTTSVG
ncbi:MAG: hypothetical protein IIA87_02125 [Nanoarchaeota archaeon]|nr:hypothetical protein [Nanoarchaeota archaeon]